MEADTQKQAKKHKLKIRILSAIILIPLMVTIVYQGGYIFTALIILAALLAGYEWYKMTFAVSQSIPHLLFGLIFIIFGTGSFIFLRLGIEQGAYLALTQMIAVWASDTGAYVTGKRFGGKKLAPLTSPNKTWAGLIGSMVFTGLFMFVLFASLLGSLSYLWFFAGLSLGVIGQMGDLFVSQYKRRANLKDSGQVIPGHGGLLDRVDSWLLISPVFLSYVLIWQM
jgi:phosphatidate cytidylyltransferase